jgi:DNA modification methylase
MSSIQIVQVPTTQLRPHPHNTRTHSKKQIGQIGASIAKLGFRAPIIANEQFHILAGHGRWLAAKQLALKTVPVVIANGLTDAQQRAYLLADNKLTENAGWDHAALAAEIDQLAPLLTSENLDIELTGFAAPEIDALLADLVDPEQAPVDAPVELAKHPISETGDLWELGRHRLLCGNARKAADVAQLMAAAQATIVFTDPPYNVEIASVQGRGRTRHREFAEASGELPPKGFVRFLAQALSLAAKHTVDGSIHYICMDWRHIGELLTAAAPIYGPPKNLVVWVKSNGGQGTFYRSQHELVFVFKKGGGPHLNNFELGQHGRNRTNVWTYAGVNSFRKGRLADLSLHPTVKPVRLVADALLDCSRRGDIVLDPFIGSGTTIVAAEQVGRRGYGLEIDPLYVDAAVRRWQTFTKRDAILKATGQTFDEVARARSSQIKRTAK